jgi:hypothetical protein
MSKSRWWKLVSLTTDLAVYLNIAGSCIWNLWRGDHHYAMILLAIMYCINKVER